jgi:hypothetical protein
MKNKSASEKLDLAIALLETKRTEDLIALRAQFHTTYDSLKPLNILRKTFKNLMESPEVKGDITGHIVGIAAGFLSKKVVVGSSNNPIKGAFGMLIQIAVTNLVSRNAHGIKSVSESILLRILKFRKDSQQAVRIEEEKLKYQPEEISSID